MKQSISFFVILFLYGTTTLAQQTKPDLSWFQDAKFGLFIHWGLYAQTAGDWEGHKTKGGEHFMMYEKIPLKTYALIGKDFNPTRYHAEEWVKQAKAAGMKYIVYTSKHHDGFAMYHSKASEYNIYNYTPFKRDPLAELAKACKKYGLKLGLYYSLGRDWQDPDVPTNWPQKAGRSNTWDYPDEDAKVFNRYFERKVKPQITELLTNYGDIAVMWFDTPELISKNESAELRSLINKLQPACLINSRIGNGRGDFEISEQKLQASATKPWEACITIGQNWSYNRHDSTWKSAELLVRNLINVVGRNGNLLLNVGPKGDGTFPSWATKRLDSVGAWMSINSEAITGTKPYRIPAEGNEAENAVINKPKVEGKMADAVYDATPKLLSPDIFFTQKGNDVFVLLRSWDKKQFDIKSLKGISISSVELLGSKEKVTWKQTDSGVSVTLPANFKKLSKIPVYTLRVTLK
ncbi:alpha-L-fucosidase [Pedobacter frigidisoli]|uniref:alpha-L-fucosidase n=1 Tax=Pedobacter frigidisoli TaxID=2530455 RepID=UPI00293189D6|nr:alpha-L-fucosidase [Pedobacter frigidisoli]